ncbi:MULTISPECIES: DUF2789 domain-containing protein [Pseudoalteromonas]|uniref:DUF2789 domain-containing protein n=1 Tax=Pseudoalteromonas ruthenica TaxID=151081 RepID=A0A0F4PJW6_9GAMM|nr:MULTISPECIES: DUF2789 domain-containing protein [Pseudoalteromonas]KJY95283.1 hypothetical protein TW76_15960 [Pseudoalteromonas ruthenica]KJY96125.1 hypothetical protein TW72_17395 [Pseudoalteromonas ruthenica]MCF2861230.1 DUF2789 domain-containing protein [Pseudoalteromonas sp. CNAT2-18]MCG7545165.1 DUF2789 domain-containing protein [Pseudoalteromonas sp. MM17-2]MCG7557731.1 DUF2789 domain-containing protein [Pseudoalteromonas sp. CNAT2-18.1]|tara:strand:- start:5308 stop:5538 length:231 start_codon:yes stop_codon:yes gene_type:complete
MDTSKHTMTTLFQQLGLPSSDEQIEQFVTDHKLSPELKLADAPFWSQAQRHFITESLEQDADWCELIDELDAQLRH